MPLRARTDKKRQVFDRRRTASETFMGPEPETLTKQVSFSSYEELYSIKDTPSDEFGNELKAYPSTNLLEYREGSDKMDIPDSETTPNKDNAVKVIDANQNNATQCSHKYGIVLKETDQQNGCENADKVLFDLNDNNTNKAKFREACDIKMGADQHLFVCDMIGNKIHHFSADGHFIAAYSGPEIIEPWASCLTEEAYLAFTSRRRKSVCVMSREGNILWAFGCGFFKCPSGICITDNGRFIVSDSVTNRVSLHTHEGRFIKYIGNSEIKEQRLSAPRYVCMSPTGEIVISDSGNHAIKMFDRDGHFLRSLGSFGKEDGQLKTPYGISCDQFGNVLVADHYNNRVSMFSRNGEFIDHVLTDKDGLFRPKGLFLNSDLRLFVTHGSCKDNEVKFVKLKPTQRSSIIHL